MEIHRPTDAQELGEGTVNSISAGGADPPGLRDLALPGGSARAVIFKMETNPAPPRALGPPGKRARPRRPPGLLHGGSCRSATRAPFSFGFLPAHPFLQPTRW